MSTLTVNS